MPQRISDPKTFGLQMCPGSRRVAMIGVEGLGADDALQAFCETLKALSRGLIEGRQPW